MLDQLAAEPFGRLKPHLSVAMLPPGRRLWESGRAATHVYFPERGVISDLLTMRDGTTVEVGMIGREGMLGLPIILGADVAPRDARVLHPGSAVRMHASALREEMAASPQLRAILLRYAQSCLDAVAQLAACNRIHVLEQRLGAWLLRARARSEQDHLVVTHDDIAKALGVRRAGVTVAALSLQSAGFIRYGYGRITIVDAEGLKGAACECHSVIEGDDGRLPGQKPESARHSG